MRKHDIQFSLPVSILKEGKAFIAYTPALDISTVGNTFEEARNRFNEAVKLFFEEIIEAGTIDQVLVDLGWQKIDKEYRPPVVVSNQTHNFCFPAPAN